MADITLTTANWAYTWAIFYATILLTISISTFTPLAHTVCEQAGFPQPRDQPLHVYVYLFAGCQFMLGLSLAVLEAAGEWRAVSVIVACALPMGLLGTTLSAVKGGQGCGTAFWSHALLTSIGTTAGWRLLVENW
ncbi:hypothetical protein LTR84_008051 [Exophiala bonariae]|uniref:DUF4149 domain-containing protein n=1 Tax=Exophiala bonariae TaxID=1690606 RepID=A0AAV9NM66_9EURO|nr:hypothetical protein LTR84_008051 [Exophiala bonariae]